MCQPYLHVSGEALPEQVYVAHNQRRMLKLVVVVVPEWRHGVVLQPISGTTWVQYTPHKLYHTKKGEDARGWTANEYVDVLPNQMLWLLQRAKPVMLVHDMDPVNIAREVACLVSDLGATPMILPPHSPRLTPLHNAIFGDVKQWLEREQIPDWDARYVWFVERLCSIDPKQQVAEFITKL